MGPRRDCTRPRCIAQRRACFQKRSGLSKRPCDLRSADFLLASPGSAQLLLLQYTIATRDETGTVLSRPLGTLT